MLCQVFVLRRDIVTYDVFYNQREDIVDYLTEKNPHYSYKTIKDMNYNQIHEGSVQSLYLYR